MKIAIITSGLLPVPATKGGAIETLLDTFISENEKQKKANITVFSISDKKAKEKVKIDNYSKTKYVFINGASNFIIRVINKLLKRNIPINKYYQKKVIKIIQKEEYDYVIVENYPELVLSLEKFKVIPYIHSDVFNKDISNCEEILSDSYKVITVSNFIKEKVLEINPNYRDKVVTVYNSIDFEKLEKEEYINYRNSYREKYKIDKTDFVFAYLGRISKEKGTLELIKAFNKVNIPNKKLLIIGGIWYGSKKKNSYLEELEKISGSDIIYTGYVEHCDIRKILCAVDVGIVPSICNEAAGLSVVEFMNTGNIVIASDMGGIKEYLNKENNYLVKYENNDTFINELCEAMEKANNNRNDIENKQKLNYEYSKKFTVNKNYNEIIKVLESSDING